MMALLTTQQNTRTVHPTLLTPTPQLTEKVAKLYAEVESLQQKLLACQAVALKAYNNGFADGKELIRNQLKVTAWMSESGTCISNHMKTTAIDLNADWAPKYDLPLYSLKP